MPVQPVLALRRRCGINGHPLPAVLAVGSVPCGASGHSEGAVDQRAKDATAMRTALIISAPWRSKPGHGAGPFRCRPAWRPVLHPPRPASRCSRRRAPGTPRPPSARSAGRWWPKTASRAVAPSITQRSAAAIRAGTARGSDQRRGAQDEEDVVDVGADDVAERHVGLPAQRGDDGGRQLRQGGADRDQGQADHLLRHAQGAGRRHRAVRPAASRPGSCRRCRRRRAPGRPAGRPPCRRRSRPPPRRPWPRRPGGARSRTSVPMV